MSTSSGVLAELADLQARVSELEAQVTGVDESTKPNYLTVDPVTGVIGANFAGLIQASGLILLVGPGGSAIDWETTAGVVEASLTSDADGNLTLAGGSLTADLDGSFSGVVGAAGVLIPEEVSSGFVFSAPNAIGWEDSSHVIQEYVFGVNDSGTHILFLGLSQTEYITVQSAEIVAKLATAAAVVIDEYGRSNFFQIGPAGPYQSTGGTTTLTWGGGSSYSANQVITIPGASGNCNGVAVPTGSNSNTGRMPVIGVTNLGGGQVEIYGQDFGGVPGAGSTCGVAYMVWGN